jgi:quercetin dioxygenase-like cupin family protein
MDNVRRVIHEHPQVERSFGAVAAVFTWLAWLTICPALGFPTLGTAAMVNRAIFGTIDPGFWVGWVIVIAALVVAIAVFFILARAHLVRVSIRTGVIYGAALWLFAGVVVMPLLGIRTSPPPAAFIPGVQPADPMQATVMMYSLGPLASVAALIAWLLFGATLGATGSAPRRRDTGPASPGTRMKRFFLGTAMFAALALAVVVSSPGQVHAKNSAVAGVTVQTLAHGQLSNLPDVRVYIDILEFRQVPGAAYGPHNHVPLFVYTLHGIATISFPGGAARSVAPGDADFFPAVSPITNENADGRVGAGAIAVSLIVVVVLLCIATSLRGGLRRAILAVLSVSLIAGGAVVLTGATANDWYLIAVRSVSQRSQPMPRPDGRVTFSSPDVNPVPAAPYIETLSAITVPSGARYAALGAPGPQMIVVLQGTAHVQVANENQQLGGSGAVFVQAGNALAIVNAGSDTLQVLDFAVTPSSAVPAAT